MSVTPQPVRLIDPARPEVTAAELRVGDDGRVRLASVGVAGHGTADVLLSPGWVDIHTHVFHGTTPISIRPDRAGLESGVHLVADAGSAGQMTLRGLVDYVIPTARTAVRAWLNIGSHGLVHLRETAHPSFIDVDATLAAIAGAPEVVCGVKVRSSGAIVGAMGLQPLQLGRLVAREAGVPLMVHVGEAPPPIDDVLDQLDQGDVITHCFHGKTGRPWMSDGRPGDALRRALDRGVRLDVGHGAASFAIGVAAAAITAGHPPDTISTDIHVRNVGGPVYDLAAVMTKLLCAGMPLAAVIRAVTETPRQILREPPDGWLDPDGTIRSGTLFRVDDISPAGRRYVDAAGTVITPEEHIVPVAVVVDGEYRALATDAATR